MAVPVTELQRSRGRLGLRFKHANCSTRLGDLYQQGCLKARFPRSAVRQPAEAILINVAGGLTDDDELDMAVRWDDRARGIVTTQAAERVYRCREAPARIHTTLSIGDAATACWLPQETILFADSLLERETRAELGDGSRLFAVESLVFGRTAMGETLDAGYLRDRLQIRQNGRLIFTDALLLAGSDEDPIRKQLGRRSVLDGGRCLATLVFAGPADDDLLDRLRALIDRSTVEGGASNLGAVVVMRLVARDTTSMRSLILELYLACLGQSGFGEPRVWHC